LRQVVGKLPLRDLSPKAVELIRERGFPVEIDEEAPSAYAAFEGGDEPNGIAVDGALLALAVADRVTPAPPRIIQPPNSNQTPRPRTTLGDLASAVSGLRQLGPAATPNLARPEVVAEQENEQQQQAAQAALAALGVAGATSGSKKRASPATGGATNAAPQKKRVAKAKQAAVAEGAVASVASALEDAADMTDADEVAPPPEFPPQIGLDRLEYDAALLVKGAPIAHWLPDHQEWQVGRITALKYMGHKWAQYPNLPKDRRNKSVEYSHAFREVDHGKLWWFVREREPTADELDSFSS
jgi:hypothetical protein